MQVQGKFIGDRENANAAMDEAEKAMGRLAKARRMLSTKTPGNANRLNDFVRGAKAYLANAEAFLDQAGRS